MSKRVKDGERKAMIVSAADGTKTTGEIASATGASRGHVINVVAECGLPVKGGSRGRKRKAAIAEAAE